MAILRVLQEPEKILRQATKEVPIEEIKSDRIQWLIHDMSDTLHSIDIGIGISAFYLLFGGIFYYIGHKIENIRDKMHPLR